jgi:hypothetical protein
MTRCASTLTADSSRAFKVAAREVRDDMGPMLLCNIRRCQAFFLVASDRLTAISRRGSGCGMNGVLLDRQPDVRARRRWR